MTYTSFPMPINIGIRYRDNEGFNLIYDGILVSSSLIIDWVSVITAKETPLTPRSGVINSSRDPWSVTTIAINGLLQIISKWKSGLQ